MVNIPSDLRKNKETVIGNMDLRESVCLFLGLLLALGILYYIRVIIGYKRIVIAAFIAGIFVTPFLFFGFKKIYGMKVDKYFKVYVNNKIIANEKRLPVCINEEVAIKNKKYEIIRYYKLKTRKELISLREYLKGKGLILTEYIDYNNERYIIFRLDGKDLILEQLKRNRELIENKRKEIREFVINVVNNIKKQKIKLTKKNKKSRKEQYKYLIESRKKKLINVNKKIKKLKNELKYLKSKTFKEIKNEVDIFNNLSNVKAIRIFTKYSGKDNKKNNNKIEIKDQIINLRKTIEEEKMVIHELHLFNKGN